MADFPESAVSRLLELNTPVKLSDFALEWTGAELAAAPQAKLVFLRGEMGSGKTTLVSKVADVLGARDAASPSFALHTRYDGVRGSIDHFDLDRLQSADDLESTGFWDIIAEARDGGRNHFVMIEWAKRLDDFNMGTEGAAWTKGFRTWAFQLEGPPSWRLLIRRL